MLTRKIGFGVAVLLAMIILRSLQAGALADAAANARRIIDDPDVTFDTQTTWICSARTWEAALDHPLLMGALWKAYGYAPAYAISGRRDSVHVVDPTGLVGDAYPYARSSRSADYLILGQLHHWAVPVLNQGRAVFALTWRLTNDGVASDLKVYVKAGSGIGSLVLKIVRPLLSRHVQQRVEMNLRDAQKILAAVEADPAQVARRLPEEMRAEFAAAFGAR